MNDMTTEPGDELREGKERLARDLRAVVEDAESLLKHAVRDAGAGYGEARARLERSLQSAKEQLIDVEQELVRKVKDAGRQADDYVHEHPWQAVAAGAGLGFLVGLLVGRR